MKKEGGGWEGGDGSGREGGRVREDREKVRRRERGRGGEGGRRRKRERESEMERALCASAQCIRTVLVRACVRACV